MFKTSIGIAKASPFVTFAWRFTTSGAARFIGKDHLSRAGRTCRIAAHGFARRASRPLSYHSC